MPFLQSYGIGVGTDYGNLLDKWAMNCKQRFQWINQIPASEQESTGLFSDTYRVRTSLTLPRTLSSVNEPSTQIFYIWCATRQSTFAKVQKNCKAWKGVVMFLLSVGISIYVNCKLRWMVSATYKELDVEVQCLKTILIKWMLPKQF